MGFRRIMMVLFVSYFLVACDSLSSSTPTLDGNIQETVAFMLAQNTQDARQQSPGSQTTIETLTSTISPVETLMVEPSVTPTYTPTLTFTNTPVPTGTETATPSITITPIPGTPTPDLTLAARQLQTRIDNSRILILEDIIVEGNLLPRIDKAINGLSLTNAKIVNNYANWGSFLFELKSPQPYDLIIVATEDRTIQKIDIWTDIIRRVNENTALIVESWYLNQIQVGVITPLLERCGIEMQGEWMRHTGYDAASFAVYPVQPDNPVFTTPNIINTPLIPSIYWMEDVGDLITLADQPHDSQILAGVFPKNSSQYGLITSCLGGRVVFQTFSSHDYKLSDMTALWQNYIHYTLANHFQVSQ